MKLTFLALPTSSSNIKIITPAYWMMANPSSRKLVTSPLLRPCNIALLIDTAAAAAAMFGLILCDVNF